MRQLKRILSLIIIFSVGLLLVACDFENIDSEAEDIVYEYELGQTANCYDLEITINSFKFSSYMYDYHYNAVEKGNSYCIVSLTIKNISTKTKTLNDWGSSEYTFSLYYDEEYKYNSVYLNNSEFFYYHDSINALETLNVIVDFKVPIEVRDNTDKSLKIEFKENSIYANEFYCWNLR